MHIESEKEIERNEFSSDAISASSSCPISTCGVDGGHQYIHTMFTYI